MIQLLLPASIVLKVTKIITKNMESEVSLIYMSKQKENTDSCFQQMLHYMS